MKLIYHLSLIFVVSSILFSCQEEDTAAISPIYKFDPIKIDPDSDGDGIPDSKDKCPDEYAAAALDQNKDGCEDGAVVKLDRLSAFVSRRPKPCEITGNCDQPNMGEVIITLKQFGNITSFYTSVYTTSGKLIGSSSPKYYGSGKLVDSRTALMTVGLLSDKYKYQAMKVSVYYTYQIDGKTYKDGGSFYMYPEDFK